MYIYTVFYCFHCNIHSHRNTAQLRSCVWVHVRPCSVQAPAFALPFRSGIDSGGCRLLLVQPRYLYALLGMGSMGGNPMGKAMVERTDDYLSINVYDVFMAVRISNLLKDIG